MAFFMAVETKTNKPFLTLQIVIVGPPPNWQGPPPTKGTEIFVGKIPREMFEWELVPIFEMCGFIYELRLMMDFSGSNRGYLFVRYSKREEASRALKGQLISECLFDVFNFPKNQRINLTRFCPRI